MKKGSLPVLLASAIAFCLFSSCMGAQTVRCNCGPLSEIKGTVSCKGHQIRIGKAERGMMNAVYYPVKRVDKTRFGKSDNRHLFISMGRSTVREVLDFYRDNEIYHVSKTEADEIQATGYDDTSLIISRFFLIGADQYHVTLRLEIKKSTTENPDGKISEKDMLFLNDLAQNLNLKLP